MKVIWKYQLEVTDEQTIDIPIGAIILSVAFQKDELCLWAMVDSVVPKEHRRIYIFGTGQDCYDVSTAKYIGTVAMASLPLIWHVFDGGPE